MNRQIDIGGWNLIRIGLFALVLLISSGPAVEHSESAATDLAPQAAESSESLFNDSHCHLTNYIQEGTDIRDFLKIMGNNVGRVALFGIPLQQQWSYRVDADRAPTYYLHSDAPLYYYSFTDAWIARSYKSLSQAEQARF